MTIKSMPVFFIDNQQMWPAGAQLHGSLVAWPDSGKYPSYVPVGLASHPEFEGKIAALAGNRGLVIALIPGAETINDVQAALSAKQPPEQYRVAIDAIIHGIMLMRAESDGGGEAHPLALLTMLGKTSPLDARIVLMALEAWMRAAAPKEPADIERAEEMASSLKSALKALQEAPRS